MHILQNPYVLAFRAGYGIFAAFSEVEPNMHGSESLSLGNFLIVSKTLILHNLL